jgi:Mg-chelatase subunit ChlD
MSLFNLFPKRHRTSNSTKISSKPATKTKYQQHQRPKCSDPAYILVIDESGSTGETFRKASGQTTTRIHAIRDAARQYIHQLRSSNYRQLVGVVGFSDDAVLYHPACPVGRFFGGLNRSLDCLKPKGLTNLCAGVELALKQLARTNTHRGNLVIITDGAANEQNFRLPGLLQQARSQGARIFSIGVGNVGDTSYDKKLLIKMANSTGGRFSSAHSYETLCRALRKAC